MTPLMSPERKLFRYVLNFFRRHPDRWLRHSFHQVLDNEDCFCFAGALSHFGPRFGFDGYMDGYQAVLVKIRKHDFSIVYTNDTSDTFAEMYHRFRAIERSIDR